MGLRLNLASESHQVGTGEGYKRLNPIPRKKSDQPGTRNTAHEQKVKKALHNTSFSDEHVFFKLIYNIVGL